MIGKDDFEYVKYRNKPIELAEKRRTLFLEVAASKSTKEWVEKILTPDGETEYHLRRFFPKYNDQGKLDFMIGYSLNVTSATKALEELQDGKAIKKAQSTIEYKDYSRSRVLVAEDNIMNQLVFRKMLEKWKITPVFAINGAEALSKLGTEEFDMVFMDLQMPTMNGFLSKPIEPMELQRVLNEYLDEA